MLDQIGRIISAFFRLFRWWIVIMPWELALRIRFGNKICDLGPGIHWAIPYVHAIFKQSVRFRVTGLPMQTLTTLDGHTITLAATVSYCVSDLRKLYDTLHNAEDTIRNLAENVIAQYVVTHALIDCDPEKIAAQATALIDLSKYGLGCQGIRLSDYARVKTYRIIQGGRDMLWGGLDTQTNANKITP